MFIKNSAVGRYISNSTVDSLMKLVGLIVAVLGYVLISKEKVERCCFVINRSAVQFRPLAPY